MRQRQAGFTLLELIIALAIIAMVVSLSLASVRLAITSQEIGEVKIDRYQRLRFIMEQLTSKVRSLYPLYVDEADAELFEAIKDNRKKSKKLLAFEGQPDSIKFITTGDRLHVTGDKRPDLHEIRFFLEKDGETSETYLVMLEKDYSFNRPLKDTPGTGDEGKRIILAKGVKELTFRYFIMEPQDPAATEADKSIKYKGRWVDTVITKPIDLLGKTGSGLNNLKSVGEAITSMPRAVEISLGLTVPNAFDEDGNPKVTALPPTIVALNNGLVLNRPEPVKEDGGVNAPTG